ncbi:hypothetical protein HDU93_004399, partial [Gonapodya sp. JEL0774]
MSEPISAHTSAEPLTSDGDGRSATLVPVVLYPNSFELEDESTLRAFAQWHIGHPTETQSLSPDFLASQVVEAATQRLEMLERMQEAARRADVINRNAVETAGFLALYLKAKADRDMGTLTGSDDLYQRWIREWNHAYPALKVFPRAAESKFTKQMFENAARNFFFPLGTSDVLDKLVFPAGSEQSAQSGRRGPPATAETIAFRTVIVRVMDTVVAYALSGGTFGSGGSDSSDGHPGSDGADCPEPSKTLMGRIQMAFKLAAQILFGRAPVFEVSRLHRVLFQRPNRRPGVAGRLAMYGFLETPSTGGSAECAREDSGQALQDGVENREENSCLDSNDVSQGLDEEDSDEGERTGESWSQMYQDASLLKVRLRPGGGQVKRSALYEEGIELNPSKKARVTKTSPPPFCDGTAADSHNLPSEKGKESSRHGRSAQDNLESESIVSNLRKEADMPDDLDSEYQPGPRRPDHAAKTVATQPASDCINHSLEPTCTAADGGSEAGGSGVIKDRVSKANEGSSGSGTGGGGGSAESHRRGRGTSRAHQGGRGGGSIVLVRDDAKPRTRSGSQKRGAKSTNRTSTLPEEFTTHQGTYSLQLQTFGDISHLNRIWNRFRSEYEVGNLDE